MPNHVYSTIRIEKELTKEQLRVLNSISNSKSIINYEDYIYSLEEALENQKVINQKTLKRISN